MPSPVAPSFDFYLLSPSFHFGLWLPSPQASRLGPAFPVAVASLASPDQMVSRWGQVLVFHFWPQKFAFCFPGYYLQHLLADSFLLADLVDFKAACVFRWDFSWSQT